MSLKLEEKFLQRQQVNTSNTECLSWVSHTFAIFQDPPEYDAELFVNNSAENF